MQYGTYMGLTSDSVSGGWRFKGFEKCIGVGRFLSVKDRVLLLKVVNYLENTINLIKYTM